MFAQAFLHKPVLALIDEPLINFDPVMQDIVKDYLSEYVKSGGTIFISTHILEIAGEICSDAGILFNGNLLWSGRMEAVTEGNRRLSDFFLSLVRKDRHA
jgi:ABC-2 type transport system ATP-binding protein